MRYLILIIFFLSFGSLIGCHHYENEDTDAESPSTPNIPTVPTNPVHIIQPDNVAEYVDKHFEELDKIQLNFEGKQYALTPYSLDFENNEIGAFLTDKSIKSGSDTFQGLIKFGFDIANKIPINTITVCFEETTYMNELKQNDCYEKNSIGLNTKDNHYQYIGNLRNQLGIFNVELEVNDAILSHGTTHFKFIGEDKVVLHGYLGIGSYRMFKQLIDDSPLVNILYFQSALGSVDSGISFHTGRLVRNANFTTTVFTDGYVRSGAVTLFAAGNRRIVEGDGKIGVNSWCCNDNKQAKDLSRDHDSHKPFVSYYEEMLGEEIGADFYFFSIDAAPSQNIYYLTQNELSDYLLKSN